MGQAGSKAASWHLQRLLAGLGDEEESVAVGADGGRGAHVRSNLGPGGGRAAQVGRFYGWGAEAVGGGGMACHAGRLASGRREVGPGVPRELEPRSSRDSKVEAKVHVLHPLTHSYTCGG